MTDVRFFGPVTSFNSFGILRGINAGGKAPESYRSEYENNLKMYLPDLNQSDIDLVIEYSFANETKRGVKPAKSNLYARMKYLYQKISTCSCNDSKKIEYLRRLHNFEKVVRSYVPVSEIKNAILYKENKNSDCCPKVKDINKIYKKTVEAEPDDLPDEIVSILKAVKLDDGKSAYQFVEENINKIYFIPKMEKTIKAQDEGAMGTEEELTRTVFIDPQDEFIRKKSYAYELAGYIYHEAVHIAWYHKNGDRPDLINITVNERNATLSEISFYEALERNSAISKDETIDIDIKIFNNKEKLKVYNHDLKLKENDTSVLQ